MDHEQKVHYCNTFKRHVQVSFLQYIQPHNKTDEHCYCWTMGIGYP